MTSLDNLIPELLRAFGVAQSSAVKVSELAQSHHDISTGDDEKLKAALAEAQSAHGRVVELCVEIPPRLTGRPGS
jgi:hypothetical protein